MNNNNIVINSLLLNKNKNSSSSSSSSSSQYKNKITSHAAKFPSIIIANHYLCLMNMNTNTSRCEGSPSLSSSPQHHQQQQQQQQQLDRQRSNEHETLAAQQEEPPCSVCKYTGMTVCAGLSLYFIKLANEDTTATSSNRTTATIRTTKTNTNTTTATATNYFTALANDVVAANKATPMKNHRPFFYICSAGWAIAGVYRWYLD